MTKHFAMSTARIEVSAATLEQEPILANLLELYAHDFSECLDLDLGPDGRFGYRGLPRYWREPGRHPFLVRSAGKLAGFALAKRGSEVSGKEKVWDMAEFFVVRGHRRRGVGTQIAHEVWRRLTGPWEVRVMQSNVSACNFWERAISMFTGETIVPARFVKDDGWWKLFSFESRG